MTTADTGHRLPSNAVWKSYAGNGPPAHFCHANGFALGLYEPLLSRLQKQFDLSALQMRPTWPQIGPPPRRRDWAIYTDDLIAHLEQNCCPPVVGIGHSMGAACTVFAAVRRPDLFRALILIETVMVSRPAAMLLNFIPKFVMLRTEPARSTLMRRDTWSSRDEFIDDCQRHRAYRRFDEEALLALREHGVIETGDGRYRLAFPKDWEAHNYTQPPWLINHLAALQMPCLAIRTKPSVFCSGALWDEWKSRCPNTVFVENPQFGHLLPVESASATEALITDGMPHLSL